MAPPFSRARMIDARTLFGDAAAFFPGGALAAQLSISSAASHSSGRYGAEKPTTVTSSSLGATGSLDEWEVSATLPYLSVGVGGVELAVGGVVIQPDGRQAARDGFGDAFVTVGRTLPLGDEFPVDVAVEGQLKLPTGARKLSTGREAGRGLDVESFHANSVPSRHSCRQDTGSTATARSLSSTTAGQSLLARTSRMAG